MSVQYMSQASYDGEKKIKGVYEHDETLETAGNGEAIIIPETIRSIQMGLDITSGSGIVQYSLNKIEDVITDTNLVWFDWSLGTISSNDSDECPPPTAIRVVNVSGTVRLMMRGQ